MELSRFVVVLINLDPTIGAEIKKMRPCVIVSPDELNDNLKTLIVAPLTTKRRNLPTRIDTDFQQKNGQIVLDQIRTIDKSRVVKIMGSISDVDARSALQTLQELFAW